VIVDDLFDAGILNSTRTWRHAKEPNRCCNLRYKSVPSGILYSWSIALHAPHPAATLRSAPPNDAAIIDRFTRLAPQRELVKTPSVPSKRTRSSGPKRDVILLKIPPRWRGTASPSS
jgi:hypothetical protein